MTLADRIDELVAQHGSLRALARVMECSPPYICRLRSGVTKNPGPTVLRKLGLRRVVSYERLKAPINDACRMASDPNRSSQTASGSSNNARSDRPKQIGEQGGTA